MQHDRYIKFILTVIALELLWLGVRDGATPVSAQGGPTRVIITGVEIDKTESFIPVGIVGGYRDLPPWAASRSLRPLTTRVEGDVAILSRSPLKVAADRPLPVQQVDYTPRTRPGEE
jgi:hypothetical protein